MKLTGVTALSEKSGSCTTGRPLDLKNFFGRMSAVTVAAPRLRSETDLTVVKLPQRPRTPVDFVATAEIVEIKVILILKQL